MYVDICTCTMYMYIVYMYMCIVHCVYVHNMHVHVQCTLCTENQKCFRNINRRIHVDQLTCVLMKNRFYTDFMICRSLEMMSISQIYTMAFLLLSLLTSHCHLNICTCGYIYKYINDQSIYDCFSFICNQSLYSHYIYIVHSTYLFIVFRVSQGVLGFPQSRAQEFPNFITIRQL